MREYTHRQHLTIFLRLLFSKHFTASIPLKTKHQTETH